MSIKKKSLKETIEIKQKLKKSFILHSGSYVVGNAMMLAINLLFTPEFLWVLFPFFGWLIALTLHALGASTVNVKSPMKKSFILHIALFIVVNLLLFVINFVFTPESLWVHYPFLGWLIAIILHLTAYISSNMKDTTRTLLLHISLYLSTMLLLIVIDYVLSNQITWALFPLIFWGAGLVMHGVVYGTYLAGQPAKPKTKDPAKKKGLLDRARALSKRAKLMSVIKKEEEKPTQELTVKGQKTKKAAKPKKDLVLEKIPEGLTEAEEADLKKTESEVDLEEKEAICVVHKAAIVGTVYICPQCKTYYCLKCANALVEKEEKCWTCEREITP